MENALNVLLEALKRYQPKQVILFGSAARGEADAESDLDLIVIKETQEPFIDRLEAMANLCPHGVHADILVYTPEEIQGHCLTGDAKTWAWEKGLAYSDGIK